MLRADLHIFEIQIFFFPFALPLHCICDVFFVSNKSSKIQFCFCWLRLPFLARIRKIPFPHPQPADEKNINFISIFGFEIEMYAEKGFSSLLPLRNQSHAGIHNFPTQMKHRKL